jgi:ATP-dependent Zn protease
MPGVRNWRKKDLAFHEAGHAVIGRVLGLVCGHTTILADHDSAGHSIVADPSITDAHWEARGKFRDLSSIMLARVISLMAGRETEIVCFGRSRGGWGSDYRDIVNVARSGHLKVPGPRNASVAQARYRRAYKQMRMPMPEGAVANVTFDPAWDRYQERLRQKTRMLVRRHRSTIERVAAAILEKGKLKAEEIDDLISTRERGTEQINEQARAAKGRKGAVAQAKATAPRSARPVMRKRRATRN